METYLIREEQINPDIDNIALINKNKINIKLPTINEKLKNHNDTEYIHLDDKNNITDEILNYPKEFNSKDNKQDDNKDNNWINILNKYKNEYLENEINSLSSEGKNISEKIIDLTNEDNSKNISINEFLNEKKPNQIQKERVIIKENIINSKNTDNININEITQSYIIFNGKEFKLDKRSTNYEKKDKIKRLVYKYVNSRKEEKFKQKSKQPDFCSANLEYIEPNQHVKSGYFLKKDHSMECNNISSIINIKKINTDNDKENFASLCEEIMNKSTIYDRTLFKNKFKDIYNENKYNFPLNNNMFSRN